MKAPALCKIYTLVLILNLAAPLLIKGQKSFWEHTGGPQGIRYTEGIYYDNAGTMYINTMNTIHRSKDNGDSWSTLPFKGDYHSSLVLTGNGYVLVGAINYNGEIYRTTDKGDSWEVLNDTLRLLPLSNIGSALPHHVFGLSDSPNSMGLYVSADYGETWEKSGLSELYDPKLYRNNAGHFYLVDSGGIFLSMDNGNSWELLKSFSQNAIIELSINSNDDMFAMVEHKIYRSTDYGENWTSTFSDGTGHRVTDLLFDSKGNIYANGSRIIKSADNGGSWETIRQNGSYPFFCINNDYLFIAQNYEIFRSEDEGNTWIQVDWSGEYPDYFSTMNDGTSFLIGDNHMHKSTDYGNSWIRSDNGLANTSVYNIVSDSKGGIFSESIHGIFQSSDRGNSWQEIDVSVSGYARLLGATSAGMVYISSESGTYKTSNGGESWERINSPSLSYYQSAVVGPGGRIFVGTYDNLYRSMDGGDTWETLDRPGDFSHDEGLLLSKDGSLYIYPGLFRSTDNGDNWQDLNLYVTSLAENSEGHLYRGKYPFGGFGQNDVGSTLLYSTDNGDTWNETALEEKYIHRIFIDKNDGIYAVIGEGWDWNHEGILYSSDNGKNWAELNAGFINDKVKTITSDKDGYLYAGTEDHGIFRSVNPIVTSVQNENISAVPSSFYLSQNYPNPFNPSTTIKYSIAVRSKQYTVDSKQYHESSNQNQVSVHLKVYDVLGREVAVLADEQQNPGTYKVEFDASSLTSGVYYYQLQAGSFVETKKMLLLR